MGANSFTKKYLLNTKNKIVVNNKKNFSSHDSLKTLKICNVPLKISLKEILGAYVIKKTERKKKRRIIAAKSKWRL